MRKSLVNLPTPIRKTAVSILAEQIKSLGLPGAAVGIAKQGTILYTKGYGYADVGTCALVQAETEFQIGSITKQFTAAAILQLQSSGLLGLDDSILTYLPAYPFDSRITIRMLLPQAIADDVYRWSTVMSRR
jgi:CubicO group peptidase (beta-lactamase class C family)